MLLMKPSVKVARQDQLSPSPVRLHVRSCSGTYFSREEKNETNEMLTLLLRDFQSSSVVFKITLVIIVVVTNKSRDRVYLYAMTRYGKVRAKGRLRCMLKSLSNDNNTNISLFTIRQCLFSLLIYLIENNRQNSFKMSLLILPNNQPTIP